MLRSDQSEPVRAYEELVAALFTASLPLAIMTVTFILVGLGVSMTTGDGIAASALAVGTAAGGWKIWLHVSFRRMGLPSAPAHHDFAVWEKRFSAGNLAYAASIGTLAARTFQLPLVELQLLGTGMLFGFCSGQVVRIATRPRLCSLSICVAAVPCSATAAAHGGFAYIGLAAMFLVFMLGAMESARYLYAQTRQRIATNHELLNVAVVDPLTGMKNRLGLRRAVDEQFASEHSGILLAVHCFDLDGFKAVNDRYGHSAGDALLVELAVRAESVLRDHDVIARVGGDEFVVLQADVSHADEVEMFARRLCRTITAPYDLDGRRVEVGMSVGSCTGRPGIDHIDDLIGAADQRMYQAKRSGGGVRAASVS